MKPGMNASKEFNRKLAKLGIERAHRIKKKGYSENPGKSRTIDSLNTKDKTDTLKNAKKLKDENILSMNIFLMKSWNYVSSYGKKQKKNIGMKKR